MNSDRLTLQKRRSLVAQVVRGVRIALLIAVTIFILFSILPLLQSVNWGPHPKHSACASNLQKLAIALHEYHHHYGSFPPAYIADAQGRPMHSWRVLILPFLGEEDLYEEYDFSEPWNGPGNLGLAKKVGSLDVLHCPADDDAPEGMTSYVAVVGRETAWPGADATVLKNVADGSSKTILLVEIADSDIHWMEPRDLRFDEMKFMINPEDAQGIGSHHYGGAQVSLCDGSVHFLDDSLNKDDVRGLLTVDGGEDVSPYPRAPRNEEKSSVVDDPPSSADETRPAEADARVQRKDLFLDFGPGRRVHCVVAGRGPTLVYFPANGGSVEDMHLLIERIARNHRFVGIDPPGREPTEWPDEAFSFFDDLPQVYDRALKELDVGPHVVMGHSMGGMYALHHARRHPDLVRGLILAEGFVTLKIHYATAAPKGFKPFRMESEVAEAFLARLTANRKWEADRPRFKSTFWPSQQPHDARPWVAELEKPILAVIAENGQSLPQDLDGWRKRLGTDKVKDLTVEVVPNAGHWMMLDDPQRVGDAVIEFLARVK